MEPLAIPTFLFYLIWFFISRKEEDVNEFVSAVCWKQNSNVIVAANSQGTIKVSHSFIHLSFHLFIHSFIYSSFHSFVPLFLLRPFVFLSFFPSFIQFSHSFLSHWTHWTIESLNHQSIMLFSHWAIGVCDIRPYIHIFILIKYLFLILPFLHILSLLFSGKMHFFVFCLGSGAGLRIVYPGTPLLLIIHLWYPDILLSGYPFINLFQPSWYPDKLVSFYQLFILISIWCPFTTINLSVIMNKLIFFVFINSELKT